MHNRLLAHSHLLNFMLFTLRQLSLTILGISITTVLSAALTVPTAAAQSSVTFYEHPNFEGRSFTVSTNAAEDNLHDLRYAGFRDWNDRISSIRIRGRGQVVIYRDTSFQGPARAIYSSIPDLRRLHLPTLDRRHSWDNAISSFRVRLPYSEYYPGSNYDDDYKDHHHGSRCRQNYNRWPPGLGVGGCPPGLRKKGLCGRCVDEDHDDDDFRQSEWSHHRGKGKKHKEREDRW